MVAIFVGDASDLGLILLVLAKQAWARIFLPSATAAVRYTCTWIHWLLQALCCSKRLKMTHQDPYGQQQTKNGHMSNCGRLRPVADGCQGIRTLCSAFGNNLQHALELHRVGMNIMPRKLRIRSRRRQLHYLLTVWISLVHPVTSFAGCGVTVAFSFLYCCVVLHLSSVKKKTFFLQSPHMIYTRIPMHLPQLQKKATAKQSVTKPPQSVHRAHAWPCQIKIVTTNNTNSREGMLME